MYESQDLWSAGDMKLFSLVMRSMSGSESSLGSGPEQYGLLWKVPEVSTASAKVFSIFRIYHSSLGMDNPLAFLPSIPCNELQFLSKTTLSQKPRLESQKSKGSTGGRWGRPAATHGARTSSQMLCPRRHQSCCFWSHGEKEHWPETRKRKQVLSRSHAVL